jgi:hypothetical protein
MLVRVRSEIVKHRLHAVVTGVITGLLGTASVAARKDWHDRFWGPDEVDIASAGNGGVASASADGGAVSVGNINSGGNVGNAIAVGDTSWGSVYIDGGLVSNVTDVGIDASGGTSIADASGGSYNLAFVS